MHRKVMSFLDMIQRLRVECVIAVFNSFFKSFRLSRVGRFVPERIAHHVYQYLMEGEVYNRITLIKTVLNCSY